MITFSFRPRSRSTLPLIAASVSTRVVSWKDAAESHDVDLRLEGVADLELLLRGHAHLAGALLADDLELAVDLGDDGLALRDASLEQLFHAGQALGDVHAGDAAGVERAHGQLRARLADRLRCDDAHRLADLDQLARGQVAPVARAADALARLAHEHRPHLYRRAPGGHLTSR